MKKRRFTPLVYVFLLLFAQQSAFTHAVWHAQAHPPAHYQDNSDASFQGELCGLHGAFTQVLGGVQPADKYPPRRQIDDETIEHRSGACVTLELHVPLCRGPPILL